MKNPLKFSMQEQLLMGLIALGGLIILLLATAIYMTIAADVTVLKMNNSIFKTLLIINALFGVMFLGSTFIGLYSQYQMAKIAEGVSGLQDMAKNLVDAFSMKGGETHGGQGRI